MAFIKKLVRYSLLIVFCYMFVCVCKSLSLLEIFDKDWIPWLKIEQMSFVYIAVLMIFIFLIFNKEELTERHILIKKYLSVIKFIIFCLMVISFYKSHSMLLTRIFMIEFLVAYCLLDYETNKQYTYNFNHQNKMSNFTEQTVIGKEKLTVNQKEIYDQLETLINKRKSTDSFNIGLIGDWGSGKTSITDTLIYELEKENKYFFLKISALTFNETGNIIEYVKNFFGYLFKRYEIDYYFGDSNVAFLGSLAMLNNSTKSIKDIVESIRGNSFIDLEKERILFNDQVGRLLEVSKRKNIILMIDDMDRTYHKENIIKLLCEFSSINGLITIVSLNKDLNKKEEGQDYSELDKYIHVRIYLDRGNDINYDMTIVNQIYEAYQDKIVDLCYFDLNEENNHFSCFDMINESYIMRSIKNEKTVLNVYNLLLELFYENLLESEMGFGEYLESLVSNFKYSVDELSIEKISNESDNRKNSVLKIGKELNYPPDAYIYIQRKIIKNNYLYDVSSKWLEDIILTIDSLKKQDQKELENIKTIDDIYSYFLDVNQTYLSSKEITIRKEIKNIIFNNIELDKINNLNTQTSFDNVRNICLIKLVNIINSATFNEKIDDFLMYLKKNTTNYRSFKIKLREVYILEKDYLTYLINQWENLNETNIKYKREQETYSKLKEISYIISKFEHIINNILIQNYILKFGTRFNQGELLNSRVFIYHGKNRKVVVISKKREAIENSIFLDITGEILNDLSKEELEEIKKKNEIIWKFK